jgi:hypothetical protein
VQRKTDSLGLKLQEFQTHCMNGHALIDLIHGGHESHDFQIWPPTQNM